MVTKELLWKFDVSKLGVGLYYQLLVKLKLFGMYRCLLLHAFAKIVFGVKPRISLINSKYFVDYHSCLALVYSCLFSLLDVTVHFLNNLPENELGLFSLTLRMCDESVFSLPLEIKALLSLLIGFYKQTPSWLYVP